MTIVKTRWRLELKRLTTKKLTGILQLERKNALKFFDIPTADQS